MKDWKYRSTNVPFQRFQFFQQAQYYLKVLVFLLPKFGDELERDHIISNIIHQMINDGSILFFSQIKSKLCFFPSENILTLEIRLTCALVWHLLKDNFQLSPDDKVDWLFFLSRK